MYRRLLIFKAFDSLCRLNTGHGNVHFWPAPVKHTDRAHHRANFSIFLAAYQFAELSALR